MEKDSALYQLMGIRMNGITNGDGEYQAILRRSDEYSDRLDDIVTTGTNSPNNQSLVFATTE